MKNGTAVREKTSSGRSVHLVLSSLQRFPQFKKSFCEDCGAPTIDQCQACCWPIAGLGPNSWMGGGPFKPPSYCGECGSPFPWTATALAAAKEYTDDLDQLSPEEKDALKSTFADLTSDTARTPLAASRFKKFANKIGPVASGTLYPMSFIQKTVSPLWLNTALSPISIFLHGSPYNPIILCVRLSTVTKQPEGHGAESAPSTVLYAVTRRSLAALQPNIASSPARRIANLMVIWWSLAGHSHGICTGNSFRYYPRIQKAAGAPPASDSWRVCRSERGQTGSAPLE